MSLCNIFDTHAHYDDEQFEKDRAQTLSFIKENGVSSVIDCGCDLDTSLKAVALSENYDFIYAAVGVHPESVNDVKESDFEQIRKLYENKKVVAVGEIGLDYHYDDLPRDKQKDIFIRQLITANELKLPVIIHSRDAHEDTLNILKQYKPKGVMHCFSGSVETAKEILKLGMYIGFGGAVTFKNARKAVEVAKIVPADRLLLETDCPYMAPVPMRGKRCDSSMIAYTAQVLAQIRRTDAQDLIDRCNKNAHELFL
ncbi:MAG: TatD family hydrolase [Acutalibacteraceae bacterium]